MKTALIFGVTGQDGSYLAEFLLKKIIKYMALRENLHLLIQVELTIFLKIKKTFFYIMETSLML